MTWIACGQTAILGDHCIECDAPLRGFGITAQLGRVCSEDCAADQTARLAEQNHEDHLRIRDLMCTCPTCTAAGRPTAAERQEYAAYRAGVTP